VFYVYKGVVHKYRPDFIVGLGTGKYLVLETKGQDTDQDKTKREFLDQWVNAMNTHGGFGSWSWAVARRPGEIIEIWSGHCNEMTVNMRYTPEILAR